VGLRASRPENRYLTSNLKSRQPAGLTASHRPLHVKAERGDPTPEIRRESPHAGLTRFAEPPAIKQAQRLPGATIQAKKPRKQLPNNGNVFHFKSTGHRDSGGPRTTSTVDDL
jgi:hypothetical protein